MVWVIHFIGLLFFWPAFIVTTTLHFLWTVIKVTWFMFTFPIRVLFKVGKRHG